jgi:hypothetical protein
MPTLREIEGQTLTNLDVMMAFVAIRTTDVDDG